MNKKGFSLVELLAVIAILGILAGVAIGAVGQYLDKARLQGYDSIYKSASEACESYIIENGLETTMDVGKAGEKNVSITTLVEEEYLEKPLDPIVKDKECGGTVYFYKKKGKTSDCPSDIECDPIDYIVYRVVLSCPGRKDLEAKVFPKGEVY